MRPLLQGRLQLLKHSDRLFQFIVGFRAIVHLENLDSMQEDADYTLVVFPDEVQDVLRRYRPCSKPDPWS
jgi:hypothetical protein